MLSDDVKESIYAAIIAGILGLLFAYHGYNYRHAFGNVTPISHTHNLKA
jgi:hypothetical protein